MSQVPQISIILPVYNAEKYLPKCLHSLVGQTFEKIEIIAVNDGSTDISLDILEAYAKKDNRLRVINHNNQGVSYTRQVGLEHASADAIMFCDADDWYQPTMCQEMFNALEKYDVDIVKCNIVVLDEEADLKRTDKKSYYRIPCRGRYKITERNNSKINVSLVSSIFKMSLIKKFAISFPEKIKAHEDDAFMFMYLSVAQHIYFLDRDLYCYWRRDNSLAPSYSMNGLKTFDRCLLMRSVYSFLQKNHLWLKEKNIFVRKYLRLFQVSFSLATEQQKITLLQHEHLFVTSFHNSIDDALSSESNKVLEAIRRLDLITLNDLLPTRKKKLKFAGFTIAHMYTFQHKISYKLFGFTCRTKHLAKG
jgi:glycosyltransferase involved in cell wall biosynthesis